LVLDLWSISWLMLYGHALETYLRCRLLVAIWQLHPLAVQNNASSICQNEICHIIHPPYSSLQRVEFGIYNILFDSEWVDLECLD